MMILLCETYLRSVFFFIKKVKRVMCGRMNNNRVSGRLYVLFAVYPSAGKHTVVIVVVGTCERGP